MKHFHTTADWSQGELSEILAMAEQFNQGAPSDALKNKSVALLFSPICVPAPRVGHMANGWPCGVLEPGKVPEAFDWVPWTA